jgi:uncharacterized membrane protein
MGENFIRDAVAVLVTLTEAGAAIVIFTGGAMAFGMFLFYSLFKRDPQNFIRIRLNLGRFLALGLEFQLASDLLRTSVSPSFEEIGKLASVAAIRTALNYFLNREIKTENEEFKIAPIKND